MSESSALPRIFDDFPAPERHDALRAAPGRSSGHSRSSGHAPARPQAAQLDNVDAALTPDGQAQAVEPVSISRWRLKHTVSNLLREPEGGKSPGVCKCGTAGHGSHEISLVRRSGRPGVVGVFFCDSPWLCPTCAPRRALLRAKRVEELFDAVDRRGGHLVFVTLTVKHGRTDGLADLKALVTGACRKARQGRPWALAAERWGIAGTLVGPEVTWSAKNGWHFHLHLAVPMLGCADEDEAEEAGEWLLERYRSYIRRAGGRAERQAQDVTVVWRREDLAAYLAKGSAAWEVASAGATKQGKSGLTPWDLAARAGQGDAQAAALFREYAQVMPGTRSCVVTKSLADKLGLVPAEDADEPGVEQVDAEDDVEVVGTMIPPRWHRVLRRGHAADVLKAVGDGWDWVAIDAMVRRLLREEDDPPPLVMRPLEHAPDAVTVARQVLAEAYRFRGRKGQALQVILDRERDVAKKTGRVFVVPDLRQVLELLGA